MATNLQVQADLLGNQLSLELLWVAVLQNSADPHGTARQIGGDSIAMLRKRAADTPAAAALYEAMAEHAERHWKSIEQRLDDNLPQTRK